MIAPVAAGADHPAMEYVLLVDASDRVTGVREKMAAHREGLLHRAFSVFVFTPDGRLLLQQRAMGKYHSGGLWSNTCCSHPRVGETVEGAATRRLQEEMGITCDVRRAFSFIYRAELGDGLVARARSRAHCRVGNGSGSRSRRGGRMGARVAAGPPGGR